MLKWMLVCLIGTITSAFVGFTNLMASSSYVAKILFLMFLSFYMLMLVAKVRHRVGARSR